MHVLHLPKKTGCHMMRARGCNGGTNSKLGDDPAPFSAEFFERGYNVVDRDFLVSMHLVDLFGLNLTHVMEQRAELT